MVGLKVNSTLAQQPPCRGIRVGSFFEGLLTLLSGRLERVVERRYLSFYPQGICYFFGGVSGKCA